MSCFEFGPNESKVILKPRRGYLPKVLSTPIRAQVIKLSGVPASEYDKLLHLLCLVWALRVFTEYSSQFWQSEQLFVCFGGRTKGLPVTKRRLSRWILDAIALAYSSLGLQCPIGVWAHSTRGIRWSSEVSIGDICAESDWSSLSSFSRYYNVDVPAL